MKFHSTGFPDVYLIEPKVWGDPRGYFYESFSAKHFEETGIHINFVQDNESCSQKDVVRGLHFQREPFGQGKLVRVIKGAVLDVILDVRVGSPTYGKYEAFELNETNKYQLWIPVGFAHGFSSLEDDTIFSYKCTNYYDKQSEGGVRWDDPDLNINWMVTNPLISEKDAQLPFWKEFSSPFKI